LLFFYIAGPFAISAQCDHLLVSDHNVVKFLDYDVADAQITGIALIELTPPGHFQHLIASEIRLSSGSNPIRPRTSRAPPVTFFNSLSS
jgi:hypothetical protein